MKAVRFRRPADPRDLGAAGEKVAGEYLRRRGYRILAGSYRTRAGEIDLVARDGQWLVFVEVKTRESRRYGNPVEAVNREKRRRLAAAAVHYLRRLPRGPVPFRFDIVEVVWPPGEEPVCTVFQDAFEMPESYFF